MYPPPPPEVLAKLIGLRLDLLSFAEFTLHISFDGGVRITLTCPFRFAADDSLFASSIYEFPLSETNMVRAIGRTVERAECESDGTLHLRFSNGDHLIAYANDPSFEAYTLTVEGKEYLV